jgi:hypothetical protein
VLALRDRGLLPDRAAAVRLAPDRVAPDEPDRDAPERAPLERVAPDEPERVPPDDLEPPDDRELLAVLELPEDLEALAVLLLEALALWARARGLRCVAFVAFAGFDDERPDVFPRLGEPRSFSAAITTPPIGFPVLGAFPKHHGSRVFFTPYPLASDCERRQRMSQRDLHRPGRMF